MAHAPRKKSLEELKAEAIAELERRDLNVRGKTPAQIRKLLRLRFKKRNSKSNKKLAGRTNNRKTLTDRGFYFADLVLRRLIKKQSCRINGKPGGLASSPPYRFLGRHRAGCRNRASTWSPPSAQRRGTTPVRPRKPSTPQGLSPLCSELSAVW